MRRRPSLPMVPLVVSEVFDAGVEQGVDAQTAGVEDEQHGVRALAVRSDAVLIAGDGQEPGAHSSSV